MLLQYQLISICVLVEVGVTTGKIYSQYRTFVTDESEPLSDDQKFVIEKLKAEVGPKLPHSYIKEDEYLIKWLEARNFDVQEAEKMLLADLRWRKSNNIDNLQVDNDFPDLLEDYPVQIDTFDKNGAPVITAFVGDWDLRNVHLTGKAPRLLLFLDKMMDDAAKIVRKSQKEGKAVRGFHVLLNLEGFNTVQHGCHKCVLGIVRLLQSYENHFPGLVDKIVIFNAPPTIEAIAPLIKKSITSDLDRHIKVFGSNKAAWKQYLNQFIDEDQLPEDFGGSRRND
ncbi:unnamed protein product [Orchesella dallaii]|uniref:CRAL-TRIO domain-containing protein n=1 Tax=Orchesella dallaii TaxID=48710 RepID=A0ABP1PKU5_9HEXA